MAEIQFEKDELAVIESLTIVYTAHAHLKTPGASGYRAFIRMLKHIPADIMRRACENIAMKMETPWNVPATIQREANRLMGVVDADEAYSLIEDMMVNFYIPELGQSAMEAIKMRLENKGQGFLFPILKRWGPEIWQSNNPTSIRAQFRDAYEKETERQNSQLNLAAGKKMQVLQKNGTTHLLTDGNGNVNGTATDSDGEVVEIDWQSLKGMLNQIAKEESK